MLEQPDTSRDRGPAITTRLLAGALTLLVACDTEGGGDLDPRLIHTVRRGDLVITVRERGEINAARDTRVTSQLEGRATLIQLIEEGSVVEGGDQVAELDVSGIVEKRAQQAISVAKAEAALEQARKNVDIMEQEIEAAERTAETRLEIARLRLEKFIGQPRENGDAEQLSVATGTNREVVARLRTLLEDGAPGGAAMQARLLDPLLELLGDETNLDLEMGELANQVLVQIDEISLARANLQMADQTLYHSRKLAEKGFITANELERHEIDYTRELSTQTVAWNNLLLLVNYTLPESQLGVALEVENSILNLASVRAGSEARRVREEADLKSIEAEFGLAQEQLATWDEQIGKGVLRAPGPGLVVYGRWDWDEPVYEGMEVRERQEIVILPDITEMVAEIKVPESQIGKLAAGQRAALQVDAFPNRPLIGRVTQVSNLPEPARRSQIVKLFLIRVLIDGGNAEGMLRPGMNANVTIDVGTVRDVLLVPLPALDRRADRHYVWLETDGEPKAVEVQLGANNLTHVEIVAGLVEGQRIHLVRPTGAKLPGDDEARPEQPEPDAASDAESTAALTDSAGPGGSTADSGSR